MREPQGISAPGKQLLGTFSTSFSTGEVLELWSTLTSRLHPQLEAELVSVVHMILIRGGMRDARLRES